MPQYQDLKTEQVQRLLTLSQKGELSSKDLRLLDEYLAWSEEQEYLACEKTLYDYLVIAWRWFDPSPFRPNWHLKAICDHVQACFELEFQKLMVTVPPRCCKSSIISVAFPTWAWGPAHAPQTKFITASYGDRLATRDAIRSRALIQTPWYQKRWGREITFPKDSNLKTRYDNTRGGFRMATTIGGAGTGEGYDVLIVDDPLKAQEADSPVALKRAEDWWTGTMSTRKNDARTARQIFIMQRLAERDLAGVALEEGDWVHLNLPMEYEPQIKIFTPLGWEDPRKHEYDLLWPERFPRDEVESLKRRLGSFQASAQLQQRPAPTGGGIIKTNDIRYYANVPEDIEWVVQVWDLAFDATKNADYTVGQCWGKRGPNKYLLDQVRGRFTFTEQLEKMVMLYNRYPFCRAVLVENKANGPAILNRLKLSIPRLIPLEPQQYGGSKEQRVRACSPEFENGNVYLPMKEYSPWVETFIHEVQMFPKGANDDTVDCCAYALAWIANQGGSVSVASVSDFQQRPKVGVAQQAGHIFGTLEPPPDKHKSNSTLLSPVGTPTRLSEVKKWFC